VEKKVMNNSLQKAKIFFPRIIMKNFPY